jgi:hypothetical protein
MVTVPELIHAKAIIDFAGYPYVDHHSLLTLHSFALSKSVDNSQYRSKM